MGLLDRIKSFSYIRDSERAGSALPAGGTTTVPANVSNDTQDFREQMRKALDEAKQNPVIVSVVNWLVNQIVIAFMELEHSPEDDETTIYQQHTLLYLLQNPSPFMSGKELLSVSGWDMLTEGQAFWHKDRRRNGQIEGLTFLPAKSVTPVGSREELIAKYVYKPAANLRSEDYLPEDIVHIRITPNPDDPKNGLSPLKSLPAALLIGDLSSTYMLTFMNRVGTAGGFLMPAANGNIPGGVLDEKTARQTREYVQKEFSGSRRGTMGVLMTAMEFIRTAIDPKSAGIEESHNMAAELICSVYGVHPAIVGLGAGNAQSRVGAALTELERAAWNNRVIPLQETIGEQIGKQLLPEFVDLDEYEREEWSVIWNREQVYSLQPDMLREAQRWALNVSRGISTRYDAKIAQGQDADDSDRVYLLPGNVLVVPEGTMPEEITQAGPNPAGPDEDAPPSPAPDTDDDESTEAARSVSARRKTRERMAIVKQDISPEHEGLLLAFERDAAALADAFAAELAEAFEDLGEQAVAAFWSIERGASSAAFRSASGLRRQNGNGHGHGLHQAATLLKQDDDPVADDVARIMAALSVSEWEAESVAPAWNGHVLRTLDATVGTVRTSLGVAVNIPDETARSIIEQGGARRGLVDFDKQTRDALFRAISEARANGEGPYRIARRIREQVPAGPFPGAGPAYRARLIARTEVAFSQNLSALGVYQSSDVWDGVVLFDGVDDPICAPLNGQRLTFAEYEQVGMIGHPNCTRSAAPVRLER